MTLLDCHTEQTYKITKINSASAALKMRFASFGISRGATLSVADKAINDLNIAIIINGSKVALRDSEARLIEVESMD